MFGRLMAWRRGRVRRGSANLRHDGVAIGVAVTIEQLLMYAERRYPSTDFFAKLIVTNQRWADDRDGLDRWFRLAGFIQRNWINPAFSVRRLSGDGLNKCHGLRDQKVALLFPLHCAPQPARISAKTRRPIKRRILWILGRAIEGWRSGPADGKIRVGAQAAPCYSGCARFN
jgi:hypothetical protein